MKTLLITLGLMMSIQGFATTAVLCGDPEEVDANEDTAIIHLIFEHPDYEKIEDLTVLFKGQEAKGVSVKSQTDKYIIKTRSPKAKIEIESRDVSYCEEEELFVIKLNSKVIKDCRCFEG